MSVRVELSVDLAAETVSGELAIAVAPGTTADKQTRAIDGALGDALEARAKELGLVLDAQPSRFTRMLPGKDDEGRVRFSVRARAEGDRLVPAHPSNKRKT